MHSEDMRKFNELERLDGKVDGMLPVCKTAIARQVCQPSNYRVLFLPSSSQAARQAYGKKKKKSAISVSLCQSLRGTVLLIVPAHVP